MIQRSGTTSRLSSWVRLVALSLLLGLGLLAGGLLVSKPAHAQSLNTITITDCSDDSQLQSAVVNAASGDTITFGCSGDIKLTKTLAINTNLTLDGSGQQVTLDGNHSVQVFYVNSSLTLSLNALTIANGSAPQDFGGGIYNTLGTVSISNSTLSGNFAPGGPGGGIANGGTMTISNSTLSGNSAPNGVGGGIANYGAGTMTISNSTLSGNSAPNGAGAVSSTKGR